MVRILFFFGDPWIDSGKNVKKGPLFTSARGKQEIVANREAKYTACKQPRFHGKSIIKRLTRVQLRRATVRLFRFILPLINYKGH